MGTGGLDATLNRISLNPARSLRLQIVLGALALAWVAFVGALLLRPSAPPPEVVAALPPLAVALPPLAEVESNTIGEPPIQIGVPQEHEPAPVKPDVSRKTSARTHSFRSLAGGPVSGEDGAAADPRSPPNDIAPLPPTRPTGIGPIARPAAGYNRLTAVYDISAHTVYLPDGTRLEAHSGLGDRLDNPRFVSERDRGPTPPGVYELTLRESLFHGVQALRLTPVGDDDVFGRSGLLAHPYMLGPNGDSNGCVSFKNYDTFLRAYQNGQVEAPGRRRRVHGSLPGMDASKNCDAASGTDRLGS